MTGYETDQLAGKPLNEIVYIEDQNDVCQNAKRAIAGKPAPDQFTFRVVTKDHRLKKLRAQAFHAVWHDCATLIWYIYDIRRDQSSEELLTDKENTLSEQKIQMQNLTFTETQVADLIRQGKTSKEIAAMLNVMMPLPAKKAPVSSSITTAIRFCRPTHREASVVSHGLC